MVQFSGQDSGLLMGASEEKLGGCSDVGHLDEYAGSSHSNAAVSLVWPLLMLVNTSAYMCSSSQPLGSVWSSLRSASEVALMAWAGLGSWCMGGVGK